MCVALPFTSTSTAWCPGRGFRVVCTATETDAENSARPRAGRSYTLQLEDFRRPITPRLHEVDRQVDQQVLRSATGCAT